MDAEQFRALGHSLVDQIASSLDADPARAGNARSTPPAVRAALGLNGGLPEEGTDAATLLTTTTKQLFEHSLFNAHPRIFGYITSSPAPIGILGDFLASALNPNVGAWILSPAGKRDRSPDHEVDRRARRLSHDCGGILVSGGNMANFVCFLAARARAWDVRAKVLRHPAEDARLRLR